MRLALASFVLLSFVVACSSRDAASPATEPPGDPPADAGPPEHPHELPFSYERPEKGDPVSSDDLAAATDRYLELLDATRYFASIDERVHGWPRSDPEGRYWYGTWWDAVQIVKKDGHVTYQHVESGSDNTAGRGARILEGACWSQLAWKDAPSARILHKMIRGMTSWFLAMQREKDDPEKTLLSRTAYPESIDSDDDGRSLRIDYDLVRPGLDNDATQFIHLPGNPVWGELYVKNKRSKDDVGQMLRAIGELDACVAGFDAETAADFSEMRTHFVEWARRVEDDGWRIATWDKSLALWFPPDDLANYVMQMNTECDYALATRLLGRQSAGPLDCKGGINGLEPVIVAASGGERALFDSFHQAVIAQALVVNQPEIAELHLKTLAEQIDTVLDRLDAKDPPGFYDEPHMAEHLAEMAALGLPLTWREVRFLHARIDEALAYHGAPGQAAMFRVFDPATPDGTYGFDPFGPGIEFKNVGTLLGACVSQYRNPASKPLFDCERIAAHGAPDQ